MAPAATAEAVQAEGSTTDVMAEIEKKRQELKALEAQAHATLPAAQASSDGAGETKAAVAAVQEVVMEAKAAEAAATQAPPQAQKPAQEKFEAETGSEKAAAPPSGGKAPAPYGVKKDGTPRSKPGPKGSKTKAMAAPKAAATAVGKGKTEAAPYGVKLDGTPRSKPGPKGTKKAAAAAAKQAKGKPGPKPKKEVKGDDWSQSGGPIKLAVEELNATEKAVLLGLSGLPQSISEPKSISDLAEIAFPDESDPTKANSKTRNGLRRLVKAGLAKKLARGKYIPTKKTISSVAEHIMAATAA